MDRIMQVNWKKFSEAIAGVGLIALIITAIFTAVSYPESWRLGVLANSYPTPAAEAP